MSNRDDFDDLFSGNDDDDLFGGSANDDRSRGGSRGGDDDFGGFDDFDNDDVDFEGGGLVLPDDNAEIGEFDDRPQQEGGSNRPLILIGVILILLLLVGFGFIVFTFLGNQQEDPATAATRAAILATNEAVNAFLTQTNEAATEFFFVTQTAAAASPTPSITPSATPSPTTAVDLTGTFVASQANQNATATEQARLGAAAGTATQIILEATRRASQPNITSQPDQPTDADVPTREPDDIPTAVTPLNIGSIQQTATALAGVLLTPLDFITPIATLAGGGALPTGQAVIPTRIMDTGLFDDLTSLGGEGGANTGILFIMAFGLMGVIFIARGLRSRKS